MPSFTDENRIETVAVTVASFFFVQDGGRDVINCDNDLKHKRTNPKSQGDSLYKVLFRLLEDIRY